MYKIAAFVLFSLGATVTGAAPIPFVSGAYTTDAFADVGGVSDGPDSAASPPDGLPISSAAGVAAGGGSASATATAADSLLTADTSAASSGDPAFAGAVATFFGDFVTPGGVLSLTVDYLSDMDSLGSTLDVLWILDDLILTLTESGTLLSGDLPSGLLGTLEIVLTSTASADAFGDTSANQSGVAFSLTSVPEPAGIALLLAGLGILGLVRPGSGRVTWVIDRPCLRMRQ